MEEKILREILAITKENNEMIAGLTRHRKIVTFMWFFKWIVFAIIAYSAYVAATPYIESAQATMQSINSLSEQAEQLKNMDRRSFSEFLKDQYAKAIGANPGQ